MAVKKKMQKKTCRKRLMYIKKVFVLSANTKEAANNKNVTAKCF